MTSDPSSSFLAPRSTPRTILTHRRNGILRLPASCPHCLTLTLESPCHSEPNILPQQLQAVFPKLTCCNLLGLHPLSSYPWLLSDTPLCNLVPHSAFLTHCGPALNTTADSPNGIWLPCAPIWQLLSCQFCKALLISLLSRLTTLLVTVP